MKMNKKLILAVCLICAAASSIFADVFNSKLKSSEREKLQKGEVLIRNIDTVKNVCINQNVQTERVLSTMKKLGPNYCAEIIQVIPYEGNENIRDRINAILLNIKDYVGIPYYSERTKKWYELYSSAEITNARVNGNETIIDCILEMSLFGKFKSLITIEENPDYYFYSLKNMENLIYHHKFTAVKKGNMVSCITVFRDGDNWILYGIGGVDALKVWFIEDRVETSFINRIKTFCNFIFKKLEDGQ